MELVAMALIIAAVILAQYIVYEKNGLKNVYYSFHISTSEAFEGDEIEIIEEIENAKRLPLVWVRSEISCSGQLTFKGQRQSIGNSPEVSEDKNGEQRGLISGIFMLRGYQKCRRVWKVRCDRRGVMTVDNAVISVSDLLGMSKRAKTFSVTDSIRVLPVPADMDAGRLSGDLFIGNMQVRRFVLPDPFMISGAREYTGREPMNRIHWAQTARTGNLMVYNNEFTTERRMMIILNMQRSAGAYRQSMPESILEPQIKSAAFALDLCTKMNAECSLAVNAETTLIIPPSEGYEHTMNVLRRLAELENMCGERMEELLSRLDFNEFTDVILITATVSDMIYEFLTGLNGKGKCCKIFTVGLDIDEEILTPICETVHIPHN